MDKVTEAANKYRAANARLVKASMALEVAHNAVDAAEDELVKAKQCCSEAINELRKAAISAG